ncbi:MAG: DNA mismatch repair endonuclease MutL [Planctomycetaceae bacterium]|nr:DNA mismatch repair endonuclease MutL [Planctomycetaceae bacterium]
MKNNIIRQLPVSMVNKIAAGEVIERPASVVKELVENSLDAAADWIDISIENGGASLIRIADNGSGIVADQLELALSPHATSKIADTDDLFRISSFGFRGEALASIAEISQLTLKSKAADCTEGASITSSGGERSEVKPLGIPQGTQIEVRNLFFNTPVRRKYMKAAATEFGHISETFVRLSLPHPQIRFTLKHNGKMIYDLPANSDDKNGLHTRIAQLFGNEVAEHLIYVESRAGSPVMVKGYVSHPNISRNNNRLQYFFLNRRFIRDKALQHALMEAYRGLLTVGRFPLAFLTIELKPDMFDVNVHPTKMEVRFLDQNRVYSGFLGTIREKFLTLNINYEPNSYEPTSYEPTSYEPTSYEPEVITSEGEPAGYNPLLVSENKKPNDPNSALDKTTAQDARRAVMDWVQNIAQSKNNEQSSGENRRSQKSSLSRADESLGIHSLPERTASKETVNTEVVPKQRYGGTQNYSASETEYKVMQMHNSYLVMEIESGIAIIDQHALHERIIYEKLKSGYENKQLESQRLLVPIPADLSPNEYSVVLENKERFKELGLLAEPFGGNTVLISAVPVLLHKIAPQEVLMSMLEPLLKSGGCKPADLLEEMLHSAACKAAVKAGDRLSADSMTELLALAKKEANAHHCPHGRPSMLVFTKEELDKKLKRT